MTAEFDKGMEQELEAFFQTLKDAPEEASPDLLARVLADAYEEQDALALQALPKTSDPVKSTPSRGLFRSVLDAIGGWPALGGLATATVAGIWIGYNPPAALDTLTLAWMDNSYGASIGATLPEYDDLLADG